MSTSSIRRPSRLPQPRSAAGQTTQSTSSRRTFDPMETRSKVGESSSARPLNYRPIGTGRGDAVASVRRSPRKITQLKQLERPPRAPEVSEEPSDSSDASVGPDGWNGVSRTNRDALEYALAPGFVDEGTPRAAKGSNQARASRSESSRFLRNAAAPSRRTTLATAGVGRLPPPSNSNPKSSLKKEYTSRLIEQDRSQRRSLPNSRSERSAQQTLHFKPPSDPNPSRRLKASFAPSVGEGTERRASGERLSRRASGSVPIEYEDGSTTTKSFFDLSEETTLSRNRQRLRQSLVGPDGRLDVPTLEERCEVLTINARSVLSYYMDLEEHGWKEESLEAMKRNWEPFESYKTNQLLAEGQYHRHFIDLPQVSRSLLAGQDYTPEGFEESMNMANCATFVHYIYQIPYDLSKLRPGKGGKLGRQELYREDLRNLNELNDARRVFLRWILPQTWQINDENLSLLLDISTQIFIYRLKKKVESVQRREMDEDEAKELSQGDLEEMMSSDIIRSSLASLKEHRSMTRDQMKAAIERYSTFANVRKSELQDLLYDTGTMQEKWPFEKTASDLTRYIKDVVREVDTKLGSSSLQQILNKLDASKDAPSSDLRQSTSSSEGDEEDQEYGEEEENEEEEGEEESIEVDLPDRIEASSVADGRIIDESRALVGPSQSTPRNARRTIAQRLSPLIETQELKALQGAWLEEMVADLSGDDESIDDQEEDEGVEGEEIMEEPELTRTQKLDALAEMAYEFERAGSEGGEDVEREMEMETGEEEDEERVRKELSQISRSEDENFPITFDSLPRSSSVDINMPSSPPSARRLRHERHTGEPTLAPPHNISVFDVIKAETVRTSESKTSVSRKVNRSFEPSTAPLGTDTEAENAGDETVRIKNAKVNELLKSPSREKASRLRLDSQNKIVRTSVVNQKPRLIENTGKGVRESRFDSQGVEGEEDVFMEGHLSKRDGRRKGKGKAKVKSKQSITSFDRASQADINIDLETENDEESATDAGAESEAVTEFSRVTRSSARRSRQVQQTPSRRRRNNGKDGAEAAQNVDAGNIKTETSDPKTPSRRSTRLIPEVVIPSEAPFSARSERQTKSQASKGQGDSTPVKGREVSQASATTDQVGENGKPFLDPERDTEPGQGRRAEANSVDQSLGEEDVHLPSLDQQDDFEFERGGGEDVDFSAAEHSPPEAPRFRDYESQNEDEFEGDQDPDVLARRRAKDEAIARKKRARPGLENFHIPRSVGWMRDGMLGSAPSSGFGGRDVGSASISRNGMGSSRRVEEVFKAEPSRKRRRFGPAGSVLGSPGEDRVSEEEEREGGEGDEEEEVDELEEEELPENGRPAAAQGFKVKPHKGTNLYVTGANVNGRRYWTKAETDCLLETLYRIARYKKTKPKFQVYSAVLELHGPSGKKSRTLKRWNNVQLKDKSRNELQRMRKEGLKIPYWKKLLHASLWEEKMVRRDERDVTEEIPSEGEVESDLESAGSGRGREGGIDAMEGGGGEKTLRRSTRLAGRDVGDVSGGGDGQGGDEIRQDGERQREGEGEEGGGGEGDPAEDESGRDGRQTEAQKEDGRGEEGEGGGVDEVVGDRQDHGTDGLGDGSSAADAQVEDQARADDEEIEEQASPQGEGDEVSRAGMSVEL
ncbi:hypothetical protein IE53DRAFT_386698 [Violaceomyces palustris]|uniref:Uncharacterized protein n=1 Tax=Violaceomyces palustris TaxID=1673888 RepID=A0ACD0NYS2_9BASI|nr:hypothetical protein IE53DRAFT_386698 [Violaceomyces palustris]